MPSSIFPTGTPGWRQFNYAYSPEGSSVSGPSSPFGFGKLRKRAIFVELLGTFIFLLSINTIASQAATKYELIATAVGIGGTLSLMIALFGGVSGGLFNPAVSTGVFLSDRNSLDFLNFLCYLVAEFLGGFLGSIISSALTEGHVAFAPSKESLTGAAVFLELVISMVLILMVQTAAIKNAFGALAPIYIGGVVLAGILVGGPVSGGCFNPAVALGQFIAHAIKKGGFDWGYFALYLFVPFASAIIAAIIFRVLYCEMYTSHAGSGDKQEHYESAGEPTTSVHEQIRSKYSATEEAAKEAP